MQLQPSKTITVCVSDLSGTALDWAVAKCEGFPTHPCFYKYVSGPDDSGDLEIVYEYSVNWEQGGPIIEREGITISALYAQKEAPIDEFKLGEWGAYIPYGTHERGIGRGQTPLIAAMRCYVASKLGNEVAIPEELL